MGLTLDELKAKYIGHVFDTIHAEIEADQLVAYSTACGEADPRYIDPSHEDFQAPVNYCAHYHGRSMLPEDFPGDRARMIDAAKVVEWFAPIRPGDAITARSQLHDMYEKSGRSGKMLFIVHRMDFTNQRDELVSRVDWRLMFRGGLDA